MKKIILLLLIFTGFYASAQAQPSPACINVNLITHEVSWDSCGVGEGNDFNILYRYIVAEKNGMCYSYSSQAYMFTTQSSMVDPYAVVAGSRDYFQKWCQDYFYSKEYPKQNAPPKGSHFYYRYKIGNTCSALIDYLQ